MKGFTFRLASLLQLRERQRDQCRIKLAAAIAVQQGLEHQHSLIVAELAGITASHRHIAQPGRLDLHRLQALDADRSRLKLAIAEVVERQQVSAAIVADCRAKLLAADAEVQKLEKLRERQNADYQQNATRQAIGEHDELASRHRAESVL